MRHSPGRVTCTHLLTNNGIDLLGQLNVFGDKLINQRRVLGNELRRLARRGSCKRESRSTQAGVCAEDGRWCDAKQGITCTSSGRCSTTTRSELLLHCLQTSSDCLQTLQQCVDCGVRHYSNAKETKEKRWVWDKKTHSLESMPRSQTPQVWRTVCNDADDNRFPTVDCNDGCNMFLFSCPHFSLDCNAFCKNHDIRKWCQILRDYHNE